MMPPRRLHLVHVRCLANSDCRGSCACNVRQHKKHHCALLLCSAWTHASLHQRAASCQSPWTASNCSWRAVTPGRLLGTSANPAAPDPPVVQALLQAATEPLEPAWYDCLSWMVEWCMPDESQGCIVTSPNRNHLVRLGVLDSTMAHAR